MSELFVLPECFSGSHIELLNGKEITVRGKKLRFYAQDFKHSFYGYCKYICIKGMGRLDLEQYKKYAIPALRQLGWQG